ncbi:m-phase phosphoprotein 6 [Holotrichia oblita]|uniref:M-phase phosphoprotein 6 n=1 Tax=Holotrichia oblita TaxID=644536 RepID=A0ACB9TC88_HOLOL|nr:m-phase phosphoprotein 6 [Holotrichia oblita]
MQDKKTKLSKAILDMKFMKKTKERVQKEEEDAEGQTMYANEITEEMRKSGNIVFMETSICSCKSLMEGRLSFGGMNPDIENYMAIKYSPKLEEIEKQMGTDVSDAEMAKGYSTLVNTMAKKFTDKKKRHVNS